MGVGGGGGVVTSFKEKCIGRKKVVLMVITTLSLGDFHCSGMNYSGL